MLGQTIQKIYVGVAAVDMRKSFHGLCGVVRATFGEDPRSGSYFVFFNKKGNQVKVLYYDRTGFAIWMKNLDKGTFARPTGKGEKIEITVEALDRIISGLSYEPEHKVAA